MLIFRILKLCLTLEILRNATKEGISVRGGGWRGKVIPRTVICWEDSQIHMTKSAPKLKLLAVSDTIIRALVVRKSWLNQSVVEPFMFL